MHFREGLRRWATGFGIIARETTGIELIVGIVLYTLTLASLTQWYHIGFRREENVVSPWVDLYVVAVLGFSILVFASPSSLTAWLSTYFSASTVVVLLNVVLLQRVFGRIPSPERSLLLFFCNVLQIVFMFATWYKLGGEVKDPLLTSVLTFATIGHAEHEPQIAMVQIAVDFILLAIFLSHLVGRVGIANPAAAPAEAEAPQA